ncbi:hypothetical protein CDIK_3872 [Cucumispora dikerogammari]|nr:hypothetical protein CDIK_3872 [Cucumispora dikerogammari]
MFGFVWILLASRTSSSIFRKVDRKHTTFLSYHRSISNPPFCVHLKSFFFISFLSLVYCSDSPRLNLIVPQQYILSKIKLWVNNTVCNNYPYTKYGFFLYDLSTNHRLCLLKMSNCLYINGNLLQNQT